MFCSKCGAPLNQGSQFCTSCGTQVVNNNAQPQQQAPNYGYNNANVTPKKDNRVMKVLAYLGFLVFIPMFAEKDDQSVKFHVGQGLLCFILDIIIVLIVRLIVWNIFKTEITVFGFGTGEYTLSGFGLLVSWVLYIGLGILQIIGIVNAATDKDKELPLIGKFAFYK